MESQSDNIAGLSRSSTRWTIQLLRIFMITWLLIASFVVSGQKIDSLNSLLPNSSGLKRANIFYELAYEYVDFDYDLAKQNAEKAFNTARKLGDSLLIVKAGRIGALALSRNSQNDSSLKLSLQILPVARRNSYEKEIKHILNRLGTGYAFRGNQDSALVYHFESLALREKTGNLFDIAVTLNNIGFVYYTLNDYDKALSFYKRSLEYRRKIKDISDLDILYINTSLCYAYKSQYDLAQKYVDLSLDLCKENCSTKFLMLANFNLGLISSGLSKPNQAKRYFEESYNQAKELNDVRFQLHGLYYLLRLAQKKDDLNSARELIAVAENLLDGDISSYRLAAINLCHQLFEVYAGLRNAQKTSFYQHKYIQLTDSVYVFGLSTNLMKVEAEYQERENKAKIEAQAKVLELSNEAISRQRTLNVVVGCVAILSIAFTIALIQNVKQKKRSNELLEQKVKERTLELELNHNMLLKSFHERDVQFQRISTEIKSSLATIKGLGVLVSHDVGAINASNYLAKIEETSNNLIQGLTRVHDQQF